MPESLNVVALISGGKDSLYSLLHCIEQGYKVVALANLYPPQNDASYNGKVVDDDDLNSFMYQTVGHTIIPLYAKALQLPLYRQQITGSAVQSSRYYTYNSSSEINDETEDLSILLKTVLSANPSVNAISTGAIQSTYQRTRVESVALRLGLTPLGYLWQYPILPNAVGAHGSVTALLDDMAEAGCESRIIKLASGGISEKLLWADVTALSTRQQLVKGLSMFFENDELGLRGAVVGEGGEFETLALSGPESVWKGGRIVFDKDKMLRYADEGGTSYVRISEDAAQLRPWSSSESKKSDSVQQQLVVLPGILDPQFLTISSTIELGKLSQHRIEGTRQSHESSSMFQAVAQFKMSFLCSENLMQISNITFRDFLHSADLKSRGQVTPVEQMRIISQNLHSLLTQVSQQHTKIKSLHSISIIHTVLLLSSISNFAEINPIYSSIFPLGSVNPPARVTIAAPLPDGVDVSMSIILDLKASVDKDDQNNDGTLKKGLHVQSRSYWAPANIGPYSQAIVSKLSKQDSALHDVTLEMEVVHCAGQIPLIPASMELCSGTFLEQTVLSLQHLWRVGQDMKVDVWPFAVAFVGQDTSKQLENSSLTTGLEAETAAKVWSEAYKVGYDSLHHPTTSEGSTEEGSGDDDFDIWYVRNNRYQTAGPINTKASNPIWENHIHPLPNIHLDIESTTFSPHSVQATASKPIPPFLAAEVKALPRNAPIEWWSTGLAGLTSSSEHIKLTYVVDTGIEPAKASHDGEKPCVSILGISSKAQTSDTIEQSVDRHYEFVTYSIPARHHRSPVTSSKLVNTYLSEVSAWITARVAGQNPSPSANITGRLASGTALLVNHFEEADVADGVEKMNLSDSAISDTTSIAAKMTQIPCYSLWGHPGTSNASIHGDEEEYEVERLDAAFIFCIEWS